MPGQFNPDMLRLARDRLGFTQEELAMKADVTQALISKLEHGFINQPSSEVVDRLSKTLECSAAFFFEPGRAIGFPHFHSRERGKLSAKPLARIGAIINIQRQHIAKLMRSYEIEAAKPIPQIDLDETGLTPEKVAERLRGYWMLPRGPVDSVVELIEQAGGIVILSSFGTAILHGISFRSEGLPPLFFMNKDVPGDRFRVSLAQELGHIVMHTLPSEEAKMEEEAERFAAAFLMPATDIKSYLVDAKISSLGRVKEYWKVPIKSLLTRSHDLKLITDSQYKLAKAQYAKSFKQGEGDSIPIEQPFKLAQIIRYHKEKLGYSLEDMAKLLSVRTEDVEGHFERKSLRLVVSN
jgi:Zn-dependent peptidase ImmA (M78 family)/transcriptional regulator with XRE-family HTH domain